MHYTTLGRTGLKVSVASRFARHGPGAHAALFGKPVGVGLDNRAAPAAVR